MKKIIVIIFFSILFVSCGKQCTSTSGLLTSDELSWIPYSGGEKLVFKNQIQGNFDTLYVGQRNISSSDLNYDDQPCTHPEQGISVNIGDFLTIANFEIISEHEDQRDLGLSSPRIYNNDGGNNFQISNYTPQNNISINGNMYNNVYIMNIDTSTFTLPTIWQIFYTKANGILRYDFTKNGGVWEKN